MGVADVLLPNVERDVAAADETSQREDGDVVYMRMHVQVSEAGAGIRMGCLLRTFSIHEDRQDG